MLVRFHNGAILRCKKIYFTAHCAQHNSSTTYIQVNIRQSGLVVGRLHNDTPQDGLDCNG